MKKLAWVTAMTALFTVLSSSSTKAQTFTESGDAGETLGAAQVVTGTSLTSISGSLSDSGDLADLFQIALTGGQEFSASTRNAATDQAAADDIAGNPTTVLLNPQLALFDVNGTGIYANDNFSGSSQATLLRNTTFTPQQSGIYYLAISSSGYNPVSSGGEIFPAMSTGNVGPTGSGGASSLTGFSGTGSGGGTYSIALSGAQAVPAPPATIGLLIMGALTAGSVLKSQKNKRLN
ncbi:MAG TPA: hypothetical protein V6D15_10110 [Oculatellaceae cyanobacterium]|jgi:hypothetical protein